jgi:hypothetical protein
MVYKRPLKEGEVFEDQRAEFNPFLSQGFVAETEAVVETPKGKKAKEVITEPVAVVEPEVDTTIVEDEAK